MKHILILFILVVFSSLNFGLEFKSDYTSILLTSDKQSISPGETIYLNINLDHKKGWHSYWKNPGESGLETSIKTALPDGFVSKPLQWPTPQRYSYGTLINFCYNQVNLILPINIASTVKAGSYPV